METLGVTLQGVATVKIRTSRYRDKVVSLMASIKKSHERWLLCQEIFCRRLGVYVVVCVLAFRFTQKIFLFFFFWGSEPRQTTITELLSNRELASPGA